MFESEEYESRPVEVRATEALGQGFDLASDFRLKFVKRCPEGGRLVVLDEETRRDVVVPGLGGGVTIHGVPECIRVDKGDHIRFKSDVLQFNQNGSLLGLASWELVINLCVVRGPGKDQFSSMHRDHMTLMS